MLCSVEPQPIAAEAGDLAMSSGGGSASTAASIEADAALYRAKVDELRSQIDEEALHALDFNPASKETV